MHTALPYMFQLNSPMISQNLPSPGPLDAKNIHFDAKSGATSGLGKGSATSNPQIVVNVVLKLCAKFQIKIQKTVGKNPLSVDTLFGEGEETEP